MYMFQIHLNYIFDKSALKHLIDIIPKDISSTAKSNYTSFSCGPDKYSWTLLSTYPEVNGKWSLNRGWLFNKALSQTSIRWGTKSLYLEANTRGGL